MRATSIHLPIDSYLSHIVDTVKANSQVILTATPGAGKTTRLPSQLLKSVAGRVAVLQPRRVAALSACQFVAEEMGWQVGQEVGYQVRQDSKFSSNTRLLFMTDAILLRRLIDDPELLDFDLIVIDEFHERNLNQDLILGILKELQELGREIKILIMSATLAVEELTQFLLTSVHIDIPGKVFPLEIIYSQQPLSLKLDDAFIQRVSKSVLSMDVDAGTQDILVFLPGVGEINRVRNKLSEYKLNREVLSLHGSMPLDEQKKVLQASDRRRIILATNIAEASVTVPGVNAVIDTGLVKVSSANLNSGFSILNLSAISKFNATQRSGRAARQMPGQCLRLWTVHEESSKPQQMLPEIARMDLTSAVLLLSSLGVNDPKTFAWLQNPPDALLRKAQSYLVFHGAVNDSGAITDKGRELLAYPLEIRFSNLMLEAQSLNLEAGLVGHCVALLQDADLLSSESQFASASESDLVDRLEILNDESPRKKNPSSFNIRKILDSSKQLQAIYRRNSSKKTQDDFAILQRALVITQADRLCLRRKDSDRGRMVGGRGVRLSPNSQVKKSEFFLALSGRDLAGQAETIVEFAHGLTKSEVLDILQDQIESREDIVYNFEKGQFFAQKFRIFQDLILDEPTLTKVSSQDVGDRWVQVLLSQWSEIVESHKGLKSWMSRWTFFESEKKYLTQENIKQALEMASVGLQDMSALLRQDLVYFIEMQIAPELLREFKKLVPSDFSAPSGGSHPIQYSDIEDPFVEIRLQEVFGLTKTPTIGVQGKPLVLKLLAPNFRPVQVTSDIEGFWQRSYVDVKKELKGRYPKHSWPDDPLTAVPVQKGRRRF